MTKNSKDWLYDELLSYEVDVTSLEDKEKRKVISFDEFRQRLKERQEGLSGAITHYIEVEKLKARIDENQSWLAVAEHEIELGKHCPNHDKYVGQCGACRKRLQFYTVAVRQKEVVEERLNDITAQSQSTKQEG